MRSNLRRGFRNGIVKGVGGMGGSPMTGAECRWENNDSPITDGGDI